MLSASSTLLAVVSASPGTAAAGIGSDRAKVSQLEQRIANQGARVQSLVSRYNGVEERMVVIQAKISDDHARLVRDIHAEHAATIRLRHVAVAAYISAISGISATVITSANATTLPEQQVYVGVASGNLNDAITTLRVDQYRTASTQSALRLERARTVATLRQLVAARGHANDAIAIDEAILSHVNANLLSLVTAANERRAAAEEQAAEQEAAAAAAAAQQLATRQATTTTAPRKVTTTTAPRRVTTTTAPPSVTTTTVPQPVTTTTVPAPTPPSSPQPGTGGYTNPLRAISGLSPERIDQGVDYAGFGPIYALGDGVVLSTVNAGWPGGTFITYRLSDGPASGLVVYAAEDIEPAVQVGETVTPSTVLGQMYEGPDGIETGWADPSALGSTMAAEYGQFSGSNSTAFGYNSSQLLAALGAPGGMLQNNPPSGSLPSQWPQW